MAVRWPKALLVALEAYAKSERLDRSTAIKGIVGKFLVDRGRIDASALQLLVDQGRLDPVALQA